jgi:hypothetical protein
MLQRSLSIEDTDIINATKQNNISNKDNQSQFNRKVFTVITNEVREESMDRIRKFREIHHNLNDSKPKYLESLHNEIEVQKSIDNILNKNLLSNNNINKIVCIH